ncbi:MAG: nucleoside triphosphate pyrophosphohydrolase [Longimicrobiales bacterium]|nr:nucleoside triphosphate pyrophosphohydrolase [Longimicrobiales bacterium]
MSSDPTDDQNRSQEPGPSSGSESEHDTSSPWPAVAGSLDRGLAVVRYLRAHCPWDASQTPLSLVPHLQEEAHEVSDAIRAGDPEVLEGELGDLLLNLAFQVVIGEEEGHFDAASVASRLEEKMERRHPHLFGLGEMEDWERMKAREREGVLHGLPSSLEPLLRAHRIQDRVSSVGFDWSEPMGAWEKVDEELDEVKEALERIRHAPDDVNRADREADLEEELGDLLFAVVNLTRLAGAHASTVLHGANEKFARRFGRLEALAREREIDLDEASLEALDALWDELKAEERGRGPNRS